MDVMDRNVETVNQLSGGFIDRAFAMWALSAFVLLYAITGGMQAVAKIAVSNGNGKFGA